MGADAVALLRKMEWQHSSRGLECSWCEQMKCDGHMSDCELAAVLRDHDAPARQGQAEAVRAAALDLAEQIVKGLLVHGFENDAGVEAVLRSHKTLIASACARTLIAHPAPPSVPEADLRPEVDLPGNMPFEGPRFRGAGPWPDGQFYVWDDSRASISHPLGWGPHALKEWPKLSSMDEAQACADKLNRLPVQQPRHDEPGAAYHAHRCSFDQRALDEARKLEAIWSAKHPGGAVQRRARIQCAILDLLAELVPPAASDQANSIFPHFNVDVPMPRRAGSDTAAASDRASEPFDPTGPAVSLMQDSLRWAVSDALNKSRAGDNLSISDRIIIADIAFQAVLPHLASGITSEAVSAFWEAYRASEGNDAGAWIKDGLEAALPHMFPELPASAVQGVPGRGGAPEGGVPAPSISGAPASREEAEAAVDTFRREASEYEHVMRRFGAGHSRVSAAIESTMAARARVLDMMVGGTAAEVERLRAALKPFADFANHLRDDWPGTPALGIYCDGAMAFGPNGGCSVDSLRQARAALASPGADDAGGRA